MTAEAISMSMMWKLIRLISSLLQTKIKEDGSFDRTVEFILPQDTYDENKEEIDSLFASMVPEGAEASWVDR